MKAKKSFGQHFLKDRSVLTRIRDAVNAFDVDVLVEVGPGPGALTEYLFSLQRELVLVEADRDMIPNLEHSFSGVSVIQGDAAQVDYEAVTSGRSWALVGNLPYNASAAIVNQAMSVPNPPQYLVIMVQKEQGQRMYAKPGEMSLLSVVVQLDYHVKKIIDVSPDAFSPKPNVDSVVLLLTRKEAIVSDREDVIQLAKAGFSSRRKQLHKNLFAAGFGDRESLKKVLVDNGLPENARAQELSVDQWVLLSRFFPHASGSD